MWHYLKLIIRTLKVNCVETKKSTVSSAAMTGGHDLIFLACVYCFCTMTQLFWYYLVLERNGELHLYTVPKAPLLPLLSIPSSSSSCSATHPWEAFLRLLFLFFFFWERECFALAVTEKQKLKTYFLQWQMAFRGHLFLKGKHVCPTYELISMATSQYDCGRDAKLLIPEHSN